MSALDKKTRWTGRVRGADRLKQIKRGKKANGVNEIDGANRAGGADQTGQGKSYILGIVVLSLGWLLLYATRTALSSALKSIGDFWGMNPSFLGFLSSSFFMAYTVLQIPSGFLADKLGSRRILLAGFGIQALGLFLGAVSRTPFQFLLSRVLTGAGQASYFACQQAIISFTLPKERRSVGTAATMGGAGVGSALGFVLGKLLSLKGPSGWRIPFVVLGAFSFVYIGLVLAFVPEPRTFAKRIKARKETTAKDEKKAASRVPLGVPSAFLALLSMSHFLSMYGFYLMLTWLPYYLETVRNIKGTLAGIIPIVMPLIMAPATIIGGAIADRKGDKSLVLKVAMPVAALATMAVPLVGGPVALSFVLGLYGATGKLVIDPGLIASVGDNSLPQSRNTVLAIFNFWGALAMAVAPLVTGFLAELLGSFDVSFYVAAILNIAGLFTFLLGMWVLERKAPKLAKEHSAGVQKPIAH